MKLVKPVLLFVALTAAGLCALAACDSTPSAHRGGSPEIEIQHPPSVEAREPQVNVNSSDIQAPHINSSDIQAPHARTPQVGGYMQRTDAGTAP